MFKKSLYILSCASILAANSTICYKKNHLDPSTIETVAFDGGECNGKLSVSDMKKNGYIVQDIKVTSGDEGIDYLYVFKKNTITPTTTVAAVSQKFTKDELREAMKEVEKEEEKPDIEAGKKIYESKCTRCHKDGTISAYNSAKPLVELSAQDIEVAIRDYSLDQKDNGMAIVMKPYANMLGNKDVKNVAAYIQTLKK